MKKRLFTLFFILIMISAFTQQPIARKAFLGENGKVLVEEVQLAPEYKLVPGKDEPVYDQLEGWPKRVASHPNFKNFRGATLADLTGDGKEEILVASFSTLHAFRGTGDLLWSLPLTGTATYPPSVADVTGDGELEIVQLTGGVPNNGRVYLLDTEGNILSGWPVSINNNWLLSAPTLADLDKNGTMEIIFGVRTVNQIHVLKADGTNFNDNWPVTLSSIPGFTPSVGDINNDGQVNIIAGASDGTLYAFTPNAEILSGFPVNPGNAGFSYQSPLLADLDGNEHLSIVGAMHGNSPEYYVRSSDGTYREGWPKAVPGGGWTYHPPTLVDIDADDSFEIFTARPIGETQDSMLFGYDAGGNMLNNFPVSKPGGLEGFISVADVDVDGQHDLVFGSNLMIDNKGFIHAWKTDGSGQLPGFPLRPDGFTFMNGANLGDVNGDGLLNLVAVSYDQTFSPSDSTVINVYDLGISVEDAHVLFGTYKGDNTRAGNMKMIEADTVYYEVTFGVYDGDGDVTAAVSGTPISSGDMVAEGDTVWFYAAPADGFMTNDWYLNGTSTPINDDTVYYADLDMDIDLQVEFKPEGINDLESSELKVYPNPSTGLFNIDVDGSYEITIVSITGQVIYNNTITNNTTLNLSDQQAGIYFLRLKSDDKVVNKRILIE